MPMYKRMQPEAGAEIAIWKIEEPESFFVAETAFQSGRKNELRRIEHISGRFLLQQLDPGFPIFDIQTSSLGKPFLPAALGRHFSISHSYPYIAACISREKHVGIDIQVYRDKILRLQSKFLSAEEQAICRNKVELITLAWSCKEAAFKWYGKGEVDFIGHMPIVAIDSVKTHFQVGIHFQREAAATDLQLTAWTDEEFATAWVIQ